MNFRYKLMQFMSGRYGIDNLFYILFGVSAVLSIINIFVRSVYLQFAVYAVIVFAFFRIMSRNHEARRRENRQINSLITKINQKSARRRQQKADYNHIYKKCPNCHVTLRLPKRPGKHKTVCPKCNHEFSVRVR